VKFRCVYGNRSRIFKNMENPNRNSQYNLPLIVVERTGIVKNNDRLSNMNNEIKHQNHSSRINYDIYTPVPIDISYSVTIVSKYQDHIDRCVSNFIPFFNKDLFVRCEHPKFEGIEYTNQVVMDDSIDFDRPDDIDPSQDDIITCTCNFTFKTYMFCGTDKAKDTSVKQVVKTFISCDPETGVSSIVSAITDTVYTGFVPQVLNIGYGFYPIPLLSTYQGQFDFVESLSVNDISDAPPLQDPWVDRFRWVIDESGLATQLSGRIYMLNSGEYQNYTAEYPRLSGSLL